MIIALKFSVFGLIIFNMKYVNSKAKIENPDGKHD